MSKYNEMPFLRLLLMNEAGIKVDGCNDSDLKPAFERNRKKLFVHDSADKGGATLCGITHKTFVAATKEQDYDHFLKMSYERWSSICTRLYWDKMQCSQYGCLPIALMAADYAFNSGTARAGKSLQACLNELNEMLDYRFGEALIVDGIVGAKTLAMVQKLPDRLVPLFLLMMRNDRLAFVRDAVRKGGIHAKYESGLRNRIRRTFVYALHNEST